MKVNKNLLRRNESVGIRFPKFSDRSAFLSAVKDSEGSFDGFVSPPLNASEFDSLCETADSETQKCFLVIELKSGEISGVVNLSQIFLKKFCSAYLGYYLFKPFRNKGLMTGALHLTIEFAFNELELHRLEANIQPRNFRSLEVVRRCGFTKEGFSRKYLMIGD
ncbi:MAG: GNAT family N-acetyltransferase [Pyrinomonadaceae bacterium]